MVSETVSGGASKLRPAVTAKANAVSAQASEIGSIVELVMGVDP